VLLLEPVRDVEEVPAAHLPDHDVRPVDGLLVARDELRLGGLARRLPRFPPRSLELGAERVRLAAALVQKRVGLSGRDRLDAPRARADRALAEDRERPDLRGRPHMRAPAELAR